MTHLLFTAFMKMYKKYIKTLKMIDPRIETPVVF